MNALINAAEKALRVLEEICDPTLTHMPEDEQVRDELRAALLAHKARSAAGEPGGALSCLACDETHFFFATEAFNARVLADGTLVFDAPVVAVNREGLECFECNENSDAFDGAWCVVALPVT